MNLTFMSSPLPWIDPGNKLVRLFVSVASPKKVTGLPNDYFQTEWIKVYDVNF